MRLWSAQEFMQRTPRRRLADLERYETQVKEIIQRVRERGDYAVREYTRRFDNASLDTADMFVRSEEIAAAYRQVPPEVLQALTLAKERITAFHQRQQVNSWVIPQSDGSLLGQLVRPLQRVGIYVPGGTASYPSSVLMNAIPAALAGVSEIIMCTPPDTQGQVNPVVLVAADLAGVSLIYKAGGAQAVAALALGTGSLAPVDKIVGPGNIYVTTAKRLVYGQVDIDMLAGPSEIMILADETADVRYVAADLLSQAEHDPLAGAWLVTVNRSLAERVQAEVWRQLEGLERKEIAEHSWREQGGIVLVEDLAQGLEVVNHYAPEHLEILTAEPLSVVGQVENAGAIFAGPYSPEPLGDYLAGPNHVLPTGGTSRFNSPLSVASFQKTISLISLSAAGLETLAAPARILARAEGLTAHARAIDIRRGDGYGKQSHQVRC